MLVPYWVAYAGIAVFVVAVVVRILSFVRMPMSLRWELYPVPHEGKRGDHGGSYLEDVNWWLKPRDVVRTYDLRAMAREILVLHALHEHNRPMWRSSFPFHMGIYLTIVATVLMMANPLMQHVAPGLMASAYGDLWRLSTVVSGAGGLLLAIRGALGLLWRRLTAPDLADYTTLGHVLNLGFFVVAFGCAFATFALYDRDFALVGALVRNLVTLRLQPVATGPAGAMVALSASLLALLLAYIPLTFMSHFVGKYFAYHSVRWNDEPNVRGGPQESAILANLVQKVSWAAPHIQSHGEKSWAEVATMARDAYGDRR
jgi:nitrate reductase gamma subunit